MALQDDHCFWAVPGSHLRADTLEEIRRSPERPIAFPEVRTMDAATAERVCRDCVPCIRRATLHGALLTPEYEAFFREEFLPLFQPGAVARRRYRKWRGL